MIFGISRSGSTWAAAGARAPGPGPGSSSKSSPSSSPPLMEGEEDEGFEIVPQTPATSTTDDLLEALNHAIEELEYMDCHCFAEEEPFEELPETEFVVLSDSELSPEEKRKAFQPHIQKLDGHPLVNRFFEPLRISMM